MFVSARIKRLRGKALIEGNGCSLVEINNAAYKPFKLALRGRLRKSCLSLLLFFKGATINKNKRLDHEFLRRPETDILKYHEYIGHINDRIR